MKTRTLLLSGLLAFTLGTGLNAQDSTLTFKPTGAKKKEHAERKWIVGIHGVAMDDDGELFGNLFNMANSWNFLPYPSRVTVEMSLNKMWRVEGALSYTEYKAGKILNDNPAATSNSFFAFDLNAKYDLNSLFGETGVFDPYTVTGLGFTMRQSFSTGKATPTVNLGLGFNIWIYGGFGINLQSTAKFKVIPSSSNYLMHSAGIVYMIGYVKDSDPKHGSIRQTR